MEEIQKELLGSLLHFINHWYSSNDIAEPVTIQERALRSTAQIVLGLHCTPAHTPEQSAGSTFQDRGGFSFRDWKPLGHLVRSILSLCHSPHTDLQLDQVREYGDGQSEL